MKSKKIISGLLALTFVFGGTAIPNAVVGNAVISASAADALTYGDYEYTINNGTAEITKYTGTDEVVEIPSEIDGVAVTSIGKFAFRSCSSLENINFPEGLQSIKDYAFSNCEKLVSISLPDSVTTIGTLAFYECTSLTDVKLSENINTIYSSNFYKCTSLKELVAPASLKTIGGNTFTSNYRSADENKEPSFTLKCYNGSAAEKYALANGVNFKVIDADDKTEYPELTEAKFAKVARIKYTDYFQFRINWTKVEGAQQYGIAVNLAGKWKVQAYTDAKTTTFTSPKLKAGSKYDVAICAKVNGKWETTDFTKRAFTIAVM